MRKLNAQIAVSGGGGGFGGRGGGAAGFGGGGVSSASANITAPRATFPAAMRLAVEMLKEPAYPEAEFDRMLSQRVKALENVPTEPTQLAAETLQRHLSPWSQGDVLYTATREEQLARNEEGHAGRCEEVPRPVLRRELRGVRGGRPGGAGGSARSSPPSCSATGIRHGHTSRSWLLTKRSAPINRKIETPDKANAQFEAGVRFQLSENDPDYPAMLLAGYMFGGPITSRVSDRIRNREGLSYGANARVAVPAEGDSAMLSGTVSLNPVNGPKVEFSFKDELAKTLKDGFTAAEVADAKKAYLDSRMVSRSSDASLLALLASHEQLGRTMKWDEQLEQKIRRLTPEQISAAFRKHVDPSAVTIVKAGDFKAAGVYQ